MKTFLTPLIAIVILAIAFQALVVIPQNEIDQKAEQAEQDRTAKMLEEARKIDRYDSCVADAYRAYVSDWNAKCEILGKEKDCTMNSYESERTETDHDEAQARCVTMFK